MSDSEVKCSKDTKSVVVFGAGVSGLTAAHYLSRRGYTVTVVESLDTPGGLAKSQRVGENIPTEYSWRGFGPWYHNVFDVMKTIKNEKDENTVFDTELSDPLQFYPVHDEVTSPHFNNEKYYISGKWRRFNIDRIKLYWLFLQGCVANKRSVEKYSKINAHKYMGYYMSSRGADTFASTFGPFIGVDSSRASFHTTSSFFQKNLTGCRKPLLHSTTDKETGEVKNWLHGNKKGWLILKNTSNESWFNPWVSQLKNDGVKFRFCTSLNKINTDGKIITGTEIINSEGKIEELKFDKYVLSINPFHTDKILDKTPELLEMSDELKKFKNLVKDGEHIQISFRIAFDEDIIFPNKESAFIFTDSEYNITLFSQNQIWHDDVSLGKSRNGKLEVKSLWSGTSTVDSSPGSLFNLPMKNLTKEQFKAEILHQIYKSKQFKKVMKNLNNRDIDTYNMIEFEVWPTWIFPEDNKDKVRGEQPKWINTTNTQQYMPNSSTNIDNLILSGAHTNTTTNLWSMEAAAESGRKAADIISGCETVIEQKPPLYLRALNSVDDFLYDLGLPNLINFLWILLLLILVYLIYKFRSTKYYKILLLIFLVVLFLGIAVASPAL